MSKRDELIETYTKEMTGKLGVSKVDNDLLTAVVKGLGPSIYLPDASKVSTSDEAEMNRVKENFCMKKLGVKDAGKIDAAIADVTEQFGSSNKNKYRAIFYYLLTQKLNKESVYK